ncbi:hypothetical protein BJ165DRAFT_1608842 [Panaeolus papilionaceus]|nr:hypothetical protein BJ165DRAFT_1608842 [Panaeolus papilionaceus]
MRIQPKSKKAITPPAQVAELITKLAISSNEQLIIDLKQIDVWKWPRSDLNAWIKVLNKFDDIMDQIITEYNVGKLQLEPFKPEAKELLSEILRFERLLLENSTNRKTFSSYDRLNSLLSTSDLDVLILALNLLLRPSQQYSAQPSVSHALSISTTRLQSLAKRWPHLRESGVGLAELSSSKIQDEPTIIPPEAREVNFNFYRTELSASPVAEVTEDNSTTSASPSKAGASIPSAVHIHLDEHEVSNQPVMQVLAEATEAHAADIDKLLTTRLLAIAIYGHTHSESQVTSALFLYEPDLVVQIAELLQVDRDIPFLTQTAAIAALDALARYKHKIQEVLTAVNAGVNHGILIALMRHVVTELTKPDSTLPHAFVDALLTFITYLSSHASGGNMIVGAGLIPLLVQIMENKASNRLPVVSKTMQLVDNVLYSFTNAFSLFCASRGVEVLVERIQHEIDHDIEQYSIPNQPCAISAAGELPVQRVATLKHILRSMHRMMQSSGAAEGLRGLIDTSLLGSIKKILEYRGLFGPNVIPLGINIMSTFVHNEPTSLAVIQEAGLPEIFYRAIEIGIEPAIEVIQAIPNAIGALCLNEAGHTQLLRRPSIIPAIFAIFTSERHLKVLIDKENAVIIGTAIDELIRHHPSLKTPVFEALKTTMAHIETIGRDYVASNDIVQWYQLMVGTLQPGTGSPPSPDAAATPSDAMAIVEGAENTQEDSDEDDPLSKNHDNYIVSFIDILGRFLEGFFQHPAHCRDFVLSTDGLQRFGRLTGLACLPYDFANSVASDSMVQVLRTMTEVATGETLLHLGELVKDSLSETRFFWESIDEASRLLPFVDLSSQQEQLANQQFRSLVTLHIRITLLSDVFATTGQSQGRAAIGLLQTLMSNMPLNVLIDLGSLHRASIWENIAMHVGMTKKGIEVQASPILSPAEESSDPTAIELPSTENDAAVPPTNSVNGSQTNVKATVDSPKKHLPRDWNATSLKHITQGLPNALAPFFQAMVKMFHARRSPDPSQRKQITESSKILAEIMLKHLNVKDFDDKASLYNYYSAIFSLFNLLLVDERTSTITLHTIQLFAFYEAGGFQAIFDICANLISKIDEIVKCKEELRSDSQKKELIQAYGAIKVALHLIHPIVSSKPLFESGQTLLLSSRERPEGDADPFEPHNFLVKVRLAALPLAQQLWAAPWLLQAPLSVSRFVVRTVLEIANGDGEESKVDGTSETQTPQPMFARQQLQQQGPDETRIRTLTDMGFPRSAVERALQRAHNNVNTATEILLAHPFPLPPDPPNEPTPDIDSGNAVVSTVEEMSVAEPSTTAAELPAAEPLTAEPLTTESSITEPSTTEPSNAEQLVEGPSMTVITEVSATETPAHPAQEDKLDTKPPAKSAEEWRKELNDARESLRASISRQSLLLIDEHLSLLFDLHVAFTRPSEHQKQAVCDLIDDVKSFSAFAYDVQEQPLANRCRLLALVLCEAPSSLDADSRNTLLDHLLALLLSSINPDHPPRWLAAHLLVTEALFTLSEEPRQIVLPKQGEPVDQEAVPIGPIRMDARNIVFDFCLRLLAVEELPSDELLSVLRLMVLLTRNRVMADDFVNRDGLTHLFRRIRKAPVSGASSYIATILRHIVEDTSIIQSIMSQTIKRYFSQPRTKTVEVNTYVRNCSAIALRDVQLFISSTKSLCQLEHPYSSPHISLQPTPSKETVTSVADAAQPDMQVDTPSVPVGLPHSVPTPSVDAIVHLLVSELTSTMKYINDSTQKNSDPSVTSDSLAPQISSSQAVPGDETEPRALPQNATLAAQTAEISDQHQYATFLMQCLTELMFSYDICKIAFLSFSLKRRPQQSSVKEPSNKFRTATLQLLLSDFITYGPLSTFSDRKHRMKGSLCNWAMNVIGALCVDTTAAQDLKEVTTDLVFVRKFVVETISRAIKDLSSSSENVEAKYGRLLALSDLIHRLLTVRVNPPSRKSADDAPTHLAKIMLEKNYVAVLTTALSEVDLNYPNVRNLVAAILRPLEFLTKVAIKMSRTPKQKDDDKSESSSSDESDDEDAVMSNTREETPDLYRNSSLGMYAGEMDDRHYDEDEDMDDEEDDQDVEMEYGDETGSEETSQTESDQDDNDIVGMSQGSEEEWDEGADEDEDLVENDNGEDDEEDEHEDEHEEQDDEDDAGEEDEDEDEGVLWEDMQEDEEGLGMRLGEPDDDGSGVPIQANHEEEREVLSDEEDFMGDQPNTPFGLISTFGDTFVNTGTLRDGGLFIHRRHRADGEQGFFGRSRSQASGPEATVHPLLLDMTSNSRNMLHGRGPRHLSRLLGNGPAEFQQTIEQILDESSLQALERLISHDGGPPEGFRIQVPAPFLQQAGRLIGSSGRVERVVRSPSYKPGREFDPLLTLPRWAEETKIIHGDFVAERAGKLAAHVVLALLPSALEAIKQAELAAEQARQAEEVRKAAELQEAEEARKTEQTAEAEKSLDNAGTGVAGEVNQPITEDIADAPEVLAPKESSDASESDGREMIVDSAPVDHDTEMAEPPASSPLEQNQETSTPALASGEAVSSTPVDITDTGIDPTFLEALPDDMREEVLNQHVRDQQAARMEQPPDSQISPEFLDALPPEIRAEIIQQEAAERARRRQDDSSRAPAVQAAEIDAASFIASLDPTLRQAVLLEQDEGFLQTLPAHMIAEAGAYRDELHAHRSAVARPPRPPTHATTPKKFTTQHDAISLLDRSNVAVLVRLLFFPQVLKKSLLFKILVNICENNKTRTELFNILLHILQDGSGDLATVDKSFAQLSVRGSREAKLGSTSTKGGKAKQTSTDNAHAAVSLPPQTDTVPDLIVQRCLEALTHVVSGNELSSLFFLTEHDLPVKKTAPRKGKGKEKEKTTSQARYPLVLLLNLLDRQNLLRTPAILESVVGLLSTITRPLTTLKEQTNPTEPVLDTSPPLGGESAPPVPSASVPPISQDTAAPPVVAGEGQSEATPNVSGDRSTKPQDGLEEKKLLSHPPQIPHTALRLIVNILTIGECSGRTFQQSLALIQHLSCIPDARDVIAYELKSKAQEFGQMLFSDLDELATTLQEAESGVTLNAVATKFSPASSTQAKLLRVLKTIDYMYTPKASDQNPSTDEDIEKVQTIYESFRFTPLWKRLGDCLAIIGEKSDTEQLATVLLPLIESLMVVCKFVGSKSQSTLPRILRAAASPRSPTTPKESMEELFITFTDAHRKVLNLMVRNNPSLMSGSFSLLVNNSRVLDFDNKRNYFNQQLHKKSHIREHYSTLQLNVRRARVFEDSFLYLQRKTGDQIKHGKLSVRFYDEEGVDAGGLTREWFQILARQMFNPNNALFQPCAADKLTYQPNKNSWVNPEHLSFFKFVGRVIGKAIYDGRLLDAYFARSLYRQLLGKPVDYRDVEWVDPEYYKSLCWILENDPTLLDLTFSVEADEFGVNRIVSLKEGGETISVTQENKREFVQLSAQYRLYSSIKDQIESLSNGFYEIIPKDLITIFNEQELELLISGTPDIDVDEWRSATEYSGYTSSDPNIVWWWRALKSFNREERAKVLSFATGTSRVPLSGFLDLQGVQGVQKFSIHKAYGEPDRLPQAHTCFNQIDLPQYTSYEMLRQQLLLAINEGGEGFAFS